MAYKFTGVIGKKYCGIIPSYADILAARRVYGKF